MNSIDFQKQLRLLFACLFAATILVFAGTLQAQDPSEYPKYARYARDVDGILKRGDQWRPFYEAATPEIKKAMDRDIAAFRAYADASLEMADAYDSGDKARIEAAQAKTRKANEKTRRTREAVQVQYSLRRYSAQNAEYSLPHRAEERKSPDLKPFLEANERAVVAGKRFLLALEDNVSQAVRDDAHDEWTAAEGEVWLYDFGTEAAIVLGIKLKAATEQKNAAALARIEEIQKANAALRVLKRQENELQLKLSKLQRQRDRANASLHPPGPP